MGGGATPVAYVDTCYAELTAHVDGGAALVTDMDALPRNGATDTLPHDDNTVDPLPRNGATLSRVAMAPQTPFCVAMTPWTPCHAVMVKLTLFHTTGLGTHCCG